MKEKQTKLEEAQKLDVVIGDRILVELSDKKEVEGIFDYHSMAEYCVKNQYGFPITYQRIIKKL